MMSRRVAIFVVVVIVSALAGGCTILASKGEYASYRRVRLAEDDQDRLVAMYAYISEHPHGTWARAIQADRVGAEPALWESGRASRDGLERYLAAFPDGPHAEEARPRLAALSAVQGRREDEAAQAREVERQRREALEERRRTWMTRAAQFWTRTMIGVSNWGSPIAQVARRNQDFSQAFGESPRPRCSAEECIKFYRSDFAIPVPGSTRIERSLELLLRLRMQQGRVMRAELLMPNKGFSRWYEQENRTLIVDEDPQSRQMAIEWAIARILPAVREVAPTAQNVDVVPEPIDPPTVRAPNQAEAGASFAPGDEQVPDEPQEQEAPQEQQAPQQQQQGGGLDDLIRRAAGDEGEGQQGEPEPEPQPEPMGEPEEMVLPIALEGYRAGNVRIVIFAASSDDYGLAYDGMFIEYEPPAEAAPPTRRRRRGRRR